MEDKQIVELFWGRDERAIEEAERRHGGLCRVLALRILGDEQDAEECVSDALLAAWGSIPPQRPEKLAAYLARLTRNHALRRRRDAGRIKRGGAQYDLAFEELDECLPGREDVERTLEQRELRTVIAAFLRGLPRTERRLFLCRYWYFDSIAELSRSFGFSESKVKSMLGRCRGKLRRYLEREGYFFENGSIL